MTHAVIANFSSSDDSVEPWSILSDIEQAIKAKIEAVGTPLKDWDVQINFGVKTGCNDAFIIDSSKREEILSNCRTEVEWVRTNEIIRPILRGRDIQRYSYDWAGLWLIATFPSKHYEIEDYPALKEYLLSFGIERLEQTGKTYKINEETIKARKKTNNKWFETQDSISYWEDFSKPKILWGEISDRSKFALDINGDYVPEATTFLMVGKDLPYLFCALNSPISEWFFSKFGSTTGVGTVRWKKYTIQELIVPRISEEDISTFNSIVDGYLHQRLTLEEFSQKTNQLLYKIVGLTESEINFVESYYPQI